VLDTPASGTVSQHPRFDLYRPDDVDQPLPVVVFVPGPVPPDLPVRPRHWPVYQGYGRLITSLGACAAVVDQPFHALTQWPTTADDLALIIESVRVLPEVDSQRVAVWAFSAGALLIGRWLADSPEWLRCVALTYPVLASPDADAPAPSVEPAEMVRPGRPLVLTRVGNEQAQRQATVDRFLARAQATGAAVQVIDVPDGQHGFDMLDHTDRSRSAVSDAVDLVVGYLQG
jgi:acetyl esterase/lipase